MAMERYEWWRDPARRRGEPPYGSEPGRGREYGFRTGDREGYGRLVEWEARGPLEWLGDKVREAVGKPRRGPKGYERADDRIRDDVCERIARSGIDAEDVEVTVERREVVLTGTVRSRGDKWRLEELADDVFGVDDVQNRLRVARTAERYGPADVTWRDDPRHDPRH
jgi:hypothetical protein